MSKKVRMLTQISGTRDGEYWPKPGGFITVDDDEAALLIRNGQAAEDSRKGDGAENALLDSHPEYGIQGVEVDGKQAIRARLAENPQPHADEPGAYHVPVLPGEEAAAKAGQDEVDKAQAEQGSVRLEVQAATPVQDDEALQSNATSSRKVTRKDVGGTRDTGKAEGK